jgi:hypothetical protein
VLEYTGFTPCGEMSEEGADDGDGSICPPPRASSVRGGGGDNTALLRLRSNMVHVDLKSTDEDTKACAAFQCVLDTSKAVLHSKLEFNVGGVDEEDSEEDNDEEIIKLAITNLLDVAEACRARKITLGLSPTHTGFSNLVCSLLYLGFRVVPLRKTPLTDVALLLDFDMGLPSPGSGVISHSDHTCTATSECSTSAEDTMGFIDPALESD